MDRRQSVVAIALCLLLAACAQGQGGGDLAPATYADHCPSSTVAPATDPGTVPPCTCPSGAVDTGDGGGATPATTDASAVPASDAGSAVGDAGVDPVALLALIGGGPRSDPNPVLCPSNLSCQSFQSFPVCMAQGALAPPTCQTNADCIAAGMPGVPCITLSIDIAGAVSLPFPFCVQLCNSP